MVDRNRTQKLYVLFKLSERKKRDALEIILVIQHGFFIFVVIETITNRQFLISCVLIESVL